MRALEKKDLEPRCEACGNFIDEEDAFCSNCGREAERESAVKGEGEGAQDAGGIEEGFIGFDCETCGASLTYDAEAAGLRCAFCGSVTLKRQPAATGRIRAEGYLPFEVSRAAALSAFEGWIGKGFFRPFGIRELARVVSMRPVYIPFWSFHARTHTYYAADSSRTPPLARADWCPVFGEREGETAGVLVPASGSLGGEEVAALGPYDFSRRKPYRREDLGEYAVEDFGLSRRGARPRARSAMLEAEGAACAALVPGRARNVRVNTLFFGLRSDPVLLPVWINAYRFKEETYRFIVNGQTGRVEGRAPFSAAKLALVIALAGAVALFLLLLAGG